jgi:hypothetical protein
MFRSIVLVCLLAAVLVGRGAAKSDRMSREDLIASLDAQAIKAGWAVNPGGLPKPTVDCSYKDDKGRLFGVYGLGERKSMILLYFVDGSADAACGYGLSVDQQEKWWFADPALLAEHTRLAFAAKPPPPPPARPLK